MAEQIKNYGFEVVNPYIPPTAAATDAATAAAVNPYQSATRPDDNSPLSLMLRKDDMLRIIQEYIKDEGVPAATKLKFYGLNSKMLPLTFFEKDDLEEMELIQENTQLIEIMSKPPQAYTFDQMQSFEQDKALLRINIKRAIGSAKGVQNERTLQNTQINQMISSATNTAPGATTGIKGAINKVFG